MRGDNHKIKDRLLLKKAITEACPEALGEIYKKHRPFLTNYIAQKVRFKDEGQDLVHTVFLRLCQGNCKYSGDSDVQGYLCGIAKNVLRDHFKAKNRQIRVNDEIEIDGDLLITHRHTEESSCNLQKVEAQQALKKAISDLPPKSRQAIELVYLDGLRPIDACRKTGCTIETFRNRLNLGRNLLEARLKNDLKNLEP